MDKIFKSGEVDASAKCKLRKKHSGLTLKNGTARDWKYDRAKAVKNVVTKCLVDKNNGGYDSAKVAEKLEESFMDINFETKETAIEQARSYTNAVMRYVNCENKKLLAYDLPVEYYVLPNEDKISVKPDYIFISENSVRTVVEVVKLSCSAKPSNFNKEFEQALFIWYAQNFLEQNDIEVDEIRASHYFLRSNTDSKDFNWNFGDKHIDTYYYHTTSANSSYNKLAPINLSNYVKNFIDGIEKDECSKDDCKRCELYAVCQAKKTPIACDEEISDEAKKLITTLSPEQKKVVFAKDGIFRVNAVAGAGKTLVICLRAANLLFLGTNPKDIILLTFTEKAANEMKQRVMSYAKGLGYKGDFENLHCQTFHSYGNEIIAKNYKKLGYSKEPRLIDSVEQKRIVTGLLEENVISGLDYRNFTLDLPNAQGALIQAINIIGLIKENSYTPTDGDIGKILSNQKCNRIQGSPEERKNVILQVFDLYEKYNDILQTFGLIDYIDQESVLLRLAQNNPFVFEDLGFKHVVIDEFQDVNDTQFKIIKGLANNASNKSLMVVGDDLQSIYAFRGSIPEYIVNFYDYLGLDGEDIDLCINYRSSNDIVDYANAVIKKIRVKVDKTLVPSQGYNLPVSLKTFNKKSEEPLWIANKVEELISKGRAKEDIAVIAYTGSELAKIGDELSSKGIEWNLYSPEKYLENSKVMGAISLGRLFKDVEDTSSALTYLNAKAGNNLLDMFSDDYINKEIDKLINQIKGIKDSRSKKRLIDLLEKIDEEDEIYDSFLSTVKNHAQSLNSLVNYLSDFETYGDNERKKRERKYPGVILTTAHSSKGLEFPVVINSISSYVKGGARGTMGDDEEWRLFFTSVTRAKEQLIISTKIMQNRRDGYHFGMTAKRLLDDVQRKTP